MGQPGLLLITWLSLYFVPGGGTESLDDAFLDNGGQSRAQKSEFKRGIEEQNIRRDELCGRMVLKDSAMITMMSLNRSLWS